ncbi:Exocyst subunit exo70 family protein [Quillaja saponaria]|uniref:Exocyst subunit exo70 family protein n=1 Tax=Quillaja saponaria TaxID=32244 RepID=A0AAD7QIN6_QUISA|nr:Exocyst subunit exo70 family protein [Quillaja saponaria]
MPRITLISYLLVLPIFWRIVGFGSSIVGFTCYALSSSFNELIGGWNPWKLVVYSTVSSLFSVVLLFAKNLGFPKSFLVKAHVTYLVLMISSLYSFYQDKRSTTGKQENKYGTTLSLISSCAFALMSMSLSRLFHMGFDIGVSNFFLGCIMVSFLKLNFKLSIAGAIICYLLTYIRSYSDSQRERQGQFLTDTAGYVEHLVVDIDAGNDGIVSAVGDGSQQELVRGTGVVDDSPVYKLAKLVLTSVFRNTNLDTIWVRRNISMTQIHICPRRIANLYLMNALSCTRGSSHPTHQSPVPIFKYKTK